MELQGKRIVVTGAAKGIGRALCERFLAERPAAVILLDRDAENLKTTASSIGGPSYVVDVADERAVTDCIDRIEREHGPIDLFCANAGIAPIDTLDASNEVWTRVWNVNVMAHVFSARVLVPRMIERGGGYLLHTASAAGLLTQLKSAPYAVSKHGAVAFAEWLAITYGSQGLVVSCLCPQGVFTEMVEGDDPVLAMLRSTAVTPEHVAESVVQGIRNERFLILPHPEALRYFQNKAGNYDRWIGGMRKLFDQVKDETA